MPTKVVARKDAEEAETTRIKRHPLLRATPQEIETYVEQQVIDLASAKALLTVLAKAVSKLVKERQ